MTNRGMIGPSLLVIAAALLWLAGCQAPVARDRLAVADDMTLLKQMQWLDRNPPGGFEFDPGGRDGYIEAVRAEIIARHDWPGFVLEAIETRQVFEGMTKTQVVTSIGWPNEFPGLLWSEQKSQQGYDPFVDDLTLLKYRAHANNWSYGRAPNNLHLYFDAETALLEEMIDNGWLPRAE